MKEKVSVNSKLLKFYMQPVKSYSVSVAVAGEVKLHLEYLDVNKKSPSAVRCDELAFRSHITFKCLAINIRVY